MNAEKEFNNIFDSIMGASKRMHVGIEIKELQKNNLNINQRCGCCYHWMTSNCDREKGHRVSANESKCDNYKLGIGYKKIITNNKNKIKELEDSLV